MDKYSGYFFNGEYPSPETILPSSLTLPGYQEILCDLFNLQCAGSQEIRLLLSLVQLHALPINYVLVGTTPTAVHMTDGSIVGLFDEPKAAPAELTPDELRTTQDYLRIIFNQLDIIVEPLNSSGSTTRRIERDFQGALPGCGSTIRINSSTIDNINFAFSEGNVIAQQYWMFELVAALCHELTHAILIAVLPQAWNGLAFLGDAITTEIGFEVEKRIFGGVINAYPQNQNGTNGSTMAACDPNGPFPQHSMNALIVSSQWPDSATIYAYNLAPGNDKIWVRHPNNHISYRPIEDVYMIWNVPFEYINRMFQDHFWKNVHYLDPDALKPWKVTGALHEAIRNGSSPVVQYGPLDFNSPGVERWIPNGYMIQLDGTITPQGWVLDERGVPVPR